MVQESEHLRDIQELSWSISRNQCKEGKVLVEFTAAGVNAAGYYDFFRQIHGSKAPWSG